MQVGTRTSKEAVGTTVSDKSGDFAIACDVIGPLAAATAPFFLGATLM